jgi:2,4-dichlorophenol 6-monooxygenase
VGRLDLPFLRIVMTGSPEAQDLYCEWQRVREIEEAGALLVRPDGVVAWRDKDGTLDAGEAFEKLGAAIRAVLDLADLSAITHQKNPSHRSQAAHRCSPDTNTVKVLQ